MSHPASSFSPFRGSRQEAERFPLQISWFASFSQTVTAISLVLLRNCNKDNKTLASGSSQSLSIGLCRYQTFPMKRKKIKKKKNLLLSLFFFFFLIFFLADSSFLLPDFCLCVCVCVCVSWLLTWNYWLPPCPDRHQGHTACVLYRWEAALGAATSVVLQHTKGGGGSSNTF